MRSGVLLGASFLAGAIAMAFARPAAAEVVIHVDKETQTMTVTVDRQVLYVWPVSTGMIGRDTPSGTFHPNRMDADHHSQEWDGAPMPNTIFFDMHGHATHGFASITHLGNPASHGCVRLAPPNAAILFGLVKMEKMANTTVIITGTTPTQQAMAKLGLPIVAAANAPLTREALTHRSSDQAQPYDNAEAVHIKEAAAYQLPQTDAFEALIPTPTFAMAGARWARRASAAQLAAYVPPAEPPPLPHEAYAQSHEPAAFAERQAAAELRTASNEPPVARPEWLQVEAVQTPAVSELPLQHAAERQPHAAARRQAVAELRATSNELPAAKLEALQVEAAPTPAVSEPQLPHAAEEQQHRPAGAGRRHAASELETAANEQTAEGEALETQAPPPPEEAPAANGQPPRAYHRQPSYALPPTIPPSARLPANYRQQRRPPAYAQPYYYREARVYGPRFYYVLPPTYGQQVYYYVQPGYAQPGYPQPQYYQLYGQY
jgi:L,D-transpeptidase catalytic domain